MRRRGKLYQSVEKLTDRFDYPQLVREAHAQPSAHGAPQLPTTENTSYDFKAMLQCSRIRDMLVLIRQRILESVPLTNGSGSVTNLQRLLGCKNLVFFIFLSCFNKCNLKA